MNNPTPDGGGRPADPRLGNSVDQATWGDIPGSLDSTGIHAEKTPAESCSNEDMEVGEQYVGMIQNIRATAPHLLQDVFSAHDKPPLGDTVGNNALPLQIGRFRIQRELGRGGHGVVFLAHDPELNRQLALKVARPEVLLTETLRRRFLREAEAAAALSHPHIVPVYEAGSAGPIHYIASAYCQGMSLSEWLATAGGKVDPQLAVQLMIVLVGAVEHAHSRGVLHRDIKPSNVMIELPSGGGSGTCVAGASSGGTAAALADGIRLLDFGLARTPHAGETLTSDILGTPAYMAPEQAAGDPRAVGVAADIYSLGATLYHMLTGQPPFRRASELDTLVAARTEEPQTPRKHVPTISRDLESICLKCLEKEPAGRYRTATALRSDLQNFACGLPVEARPIGSLAHAARWCRRQPALAAVTAAALAMFLVGSVSVVWQWRRAEHNLAEVVLQRQRALDNLHAAQDAVDELLTDVSNNLVHMPQMEPLRRSLLLKAVKFNERFLADEAADGTMQLESLRAWGRAGDIFDQLGDHDRLLAAAEKGIELGEVALQGALSDQQSMYDLSRELANAYRRRGTWRQSQQQFDAAEADFSRALKILDKSVEGTENCADINASEILRLIGLTYEQRNDHQEAGQWYRQSVARVRTLPADKYTSAARFQLAKSLNSLGIHLRLTRKFEAAMKQYTETKTVLNELVAAAPTDTKYAQGLADHCHNMGNLLLSMRRHDEAAVNYRECLEISRRLARDYPLSPRYLVLISSAGHGLGVAERNLDRRQAAIQSFQQATEVGEELVQRFANDVDVRRRVAGTYSALGETLWRTGRLEEGVAALDRSIELAEQILEQHPTSMSALVTLTQALQRLARLQLDLEQPAAAKENLRAAIEHRQTILENNPAHLATRKELLDDYTMLAVACKNCGEFSAARQAVDDLVAVGAADSGAYFNATLVLLELAEECPLGQGSSGPPTGVTPVECRQQALEMLSQAVSLGNLDPQLLQEKALDVLRDSDEFWALAAQLEQAGVP